MGLYQSESASVFCLACEKGRFNDAVAQPECESCPSGYAQSEKNATDCKECPLGRSSVNGSARCSLVHPKAGRGCRDCPQGYFQRQEAQTNCTACPDGTTTNGRTLVRVHPLRSRQVRRQRHVHEMRRGFTRTPGQHSVHNLSVRQIANNKSTACDNPRDHCADCTVNQYLDDRKQV